VLHAYNDPRMWRAEHPAGNGIMDARSLARLYGLLANGGELDGVKLLSQETIEDWATIRVDQDDLYDGRDFRVALGYISTMSWYEIGRGPRTFGDPGMGGAIGYADLDTGLGFGFTPNRMVFSPGQTDPRVHALSEAIYACL
jgi:CubicO group peptidase (beta-lactamase class C family)